MPASTVRRALSPRLTTMVASGVLGLGIVLAGEGAIPGTSAQAPCAAETEPNSTEIELGAAPFTAGALCVSGSLPQGDQDLLLWEIPPSDALSSWTMTATGVPDTVTTFAIFEVTSEPGVVPVVARGGKVYDLDVTPDGTGTKLVADLHVPVGRYLVGVSRSDPPDGTQPEDPAWSLSLEPGKLPAVVEREPNDGEDVATPLSGAFDIGGDLGGSLDHYAWTVPDDAAGRAWELHSRGVVGTLLSINLRAEDGTLLLDESSDLRGRLDLYDLRLAPGTYRFYLAGAGEEPYPYRLTTTPGEPIGDPEPNDLAELAVPVDLAQPLMRGRLAKDGDHDAYRISLAPDVPPIMRDIRLIWRSGARMEMCLETPEGRILQCRSGTQGVSLTSLLFQPGDYILSITGEQDLVEGYALRIDETAQPVPDFEAEPNDILELATPVDAAVGMTGRGAASDADFFLLHVDGEAQLWDLEVTGDAIDELTWHRADRSQIALGAVDPDRRRAVLRDLYLVPGDHRFQVGASSGEYRVKATPLGPPDPDGEREPNDRSLEANVHRIGRAASGRLTNDAEVDVFRFTLAATERLRIEAEPPPDGSIDLHLAGGGWRIGHRTSPGPGLPTTYEVQLTPGDYEVELRPGVPSEERYHFAVERLDPFAVPGDQEPNDTPWQARPLPAAGRVEGMGARPSDTDWYALPPSEDGAPLTIDMPGDDVTLEVSDGERDIRVERGDDDRTWTTDPVPAGAPLYLGVRIRGEAPYQMEVGTGTGTGTSPAPGNAPFAASLGSGDAVIAAYWPDAQRVEATLTLVAATGGAAPSGTLALDAHVTDEVWRVELAPTAELPATGPLEVPVTIHVPADAPAVDAVRVSIRASDPEGRSATASLDITTDRDAPPVAPEQAWALPPELLGGMDAAAAALGATPVAPLDLGRELQLHDGTAHSGIGWYRNRGAWTLPATLTVDLAGEDPVPVAGTILNPQAQQGTTAQVPRRFALLVSMDGITWVQVLEGELSTRMRDQAFVLPEPVEARFAQLRIDSSHGTPDDELALGEWKVIAVPGTPVGPSQLDIADAAMGGHVSWMDPHSGDEHFWYAWLDEDPELQRLKLDRGQRLTWALGFREDRAALLTELQWADPADSDPALRFKRVDIAVSLISPAGPWTEVGTWRLKRAGDGSVAPFTFTEPTWARFVRFTGDAPREDTHYWQMPATLRAIEAPTGEAYRSVVAEWGELRPVGPYELLLPPAVVPAPPDETGQDDTPETARPVAAGAPTPGRVDRGSDIDWLELTVPDGHNTLTIDLVGTPILATALTLIDAEGLEVPMLFAPGAGTASRVYSARVTPGTYRLRVEQPVSSVVMTFDTSASMADYFPYVFEGIRTFSAEVVAGEEEVLVIPFEEPPLLPEWSDQAYELHDAVNQFRLYGLSSGLEAALIDASRELSARQGARAVLVLTDAETSTYRHGAELWQSLAAVRPIVFAAHVGAQGEPLLSQQYLQDQAAVAGGFYQYARSHAEVDRTFDRLATWLRRPATYQLTYLTELREAPPESRAPGTLSVVPPQGLEGQTLSTISPDVGVEIILDTSGSMLDSLKGRRRIDLAKEVLADLVTHRLPAGAPVAVRVLGDRTDICGTQLVVPLGPLDPAAVLAGVEGVAVDRESDTALGAALRAVPDDLAGSPGTRIVLLITDSEEIWPHPDLCGDDPAAAIRDLRRRGVDARVNIVGLAVDARKATAQMRRWARLGNGDFFPARDAKQLGDSIRTAVSAPFRVLDAAGNEVASGTVGGGGVPLPPGTYSVVVLSDPVTRFDEVVMEPKGSVRLVLEPPPERIPSEGTVPEESP